MKPDFKEIFHKHLEKQVYNSSKSMSDITVDAMKEAWNLAVEQCSETAGLQRGYEEKSTAGQMGFKIETPDFKEYSQLNPLT